VPRLAMTTGRPRATLHPQSRRRRRRQERGGARRTTARRVVSCRERWPPEARASVPRHRHRKPGAR
jgi:hypothetical protein